MNIVRYTQSVHPEFHDRHGEWRVALRILNVHVSRPREASLASDDRLVDCHARTVSIKMTRSRGIHASP